MVSPPSNPELRRALERFVSSGSVTGEVREEAAAAWARAVSFGLRPGRLDSPWDPDLDSGGRPAKAAWPVLDKIGAEQLRKSSASPHRSTAPALCLTGRALLGT